MTSQIPADGQGELQGGLSSVNSLTSILGPVFMTRLFALFTGNNAPVYFPGISFFVAAVLSLLCLLIHVSVIRRHGLAGIVLPMAGR